MSERWYDAGEEEQDESPERLDCPESDASDQSPSSQHLLYPL